MEGNFESTPHEIEEKPSEIVKEKKSGHSLLGHYWWVFLFIILFILVIIGLTYYPKSKDLNSSKLKYVDTQQPQENKDFPACPSDLAGILTYPIVQPKDISSIGPIGWLSSGHSTPSDHNAVFIPGGDAVLGYAPADGWISRIGLQWEVSAPGTYITNGISISYTLCEKVVLKLTTYKDLAPAIQKQIDSITEEDKNCREGSFKVNDDVIHKVCDFDVRIPLKSGDLIGHVFEKDGMVNYETWAYDYRQFNPKYDKSLKYYSEGGEDIGHSFCLFDLYSGVLKTEYAKLFGRYDTRDGFSVRIGEPLCGTHHQEVDGTIQGSWFDGGSNPITIIHDDIDQRKGLISLSGTMRAEQNNFNFDIVHEGTVNREPSEVKIDGIVYCFNIRESRRNDPMGKVLVQLLDREHLKAEYIPSGTCGQSEKFINPNTFDR